MTTKRPTDLLKVIPAAALACCLSAAPALAQSAGLETKTGNELGVTASSYKYNEPGNMSIKATKVGFD